MEHPALHAHPVLHVKFVPNPNPNPTRLCSNYQFKYELFSQSAQLLILGPSEARASVRRTAL